MHALTLVLAPGTELPSALASGRFFYEPIVDGRRLRIWLDTDGSGFITQRTADELHLPRIGRQARLPSWVVQPQAYGGLLPVFRPDPADEIFDGIDAQFGASWFQGRIVCMDYPNARLTLLQGISDVAGRLGHATMRFPMGPDGGRIDGRQFPAADVEIAEKRYAMNVDTAATVVLNAQTQVGMHDGWSRVRATSFLRTDLMKNLHAAHPEWPYVARAGAGSVAILRAPRVTIGTFVAQNVWFSTRPGDDVFEGEDVSGKIGPTAFFQAAVTLDYPRGIIYFDP